MLIKDVNDSRKELEEIKEKINLINPDRVYINVPIRPPTESWVKIPSIITLKIANTILKPYRDITEPEIGLFNIYSDDFESEFISIIRRHPLKEEQIYETFPELNKGAINKKLAVLVKNKKIKKIKYDDKVFWQYIP